MVFKSCNSAPAAAECECTRYAPSKVHNNATRHNNMVPKVQTRIHVYAQVSISLNARRLSNMTMEGTGECNMQFEKGVLYLVTHNDAPPRRVMSRLEGKGRAQVMKLRFSANVTSPAKAQTTDLSSPPWLTWQTPAQPQSAQILLCLAAVIVAIH